MIKQYKINYLIQCILFLVCFELSVPTLAQSPLDTLAMRAIMVNQLFPQERCYLHFDNTAYYLGETMWFKAYVTSGLADQEKPQSRVLYVELCAPEGYVVETKKYKLDDNGCCHGEFELRKEILSGYYEVRAYTRYMLNWGDEAIFRRVFPVYDNVNGDNYDFKNMLERKRGFMREGKWISEEFPPADVKFYPESGHLIEGIETKVAYEICDDEGKSTKDTVYIYHDNELIVKSVPTHEGMGTFDFIPKAQGKYRAEVRKDKKKHKFEIPKIEPQGVIINFVMNDDSAIVMIKNNIDFSTQLGVATLNRGFLINYETFSSEENNKKIKINTDSIPEGVNRIVVFTNSNIPLAERQFFVRHKNILPGDRQTVKLVAKVNGLEANDIILKPHEKINITVEREDGKPIEEFAEFSISVSDAATRQTMSYTHNMYTHMLLASEIKGYIPNAEQYFKDNSKETRKKIDLLMLTRGWTSYDWSKLTTKHVTLEQPIETGISILGKLYKQTKNKKFSKLDKYTLTPQRNTNIKFNISYDDSIVHKYQFASDENGEFKIETDEFAGTKGALLTPELSMNQQMDSTYVFSINKFFSPKFAQYNYWQRNTGKSGKEEEKRDTAIVKISDYEFMLTEVDINGKRKKDRYERPPLSEVRFNFLDEWEYAKENIIGHRIGSNKNDNIEIKEILETIKANGRHNYIDSLLLQKRLIITKDAACKVPASAVVNSIFERYNYSWAYWVKMIVAKGKYHPDSIMRPDEEYLHGIDPEKMMNFKEVVIRSDIGIRQQFKNEGSQLAKEKLALENKRLEWMFYFGFLDHLYIADKERHNLPRDFFKTLTRGIRYHIISNNVGYGSGRAQPYHPNYVACFIPYEEQHKGIIPELHTGSASTDVFGRRSRNSIRRYTTVKGYNESKKFYSPSYKNKYPEDKKDIRRTLLWKHSMKANDGKLTVDLYNSSITKKPTIDVEGIGNGVLYGTSSNLTNRTLSAEKASMEKIYGTAVINNPAIIAYSFKITNEGRMLYREKEYKLAFEKFHKAAILSYPDAIFYAGVCYSNGDGVEKDSIKAFRMFHSAANAKNIPAMHNLANCYMNGIGTTADYALALKYFSKAANNGYERSMSMLGKSYEEGILTEKDTAKAFEYYKRATKKKEPYAMYKMATYHEYKDSIEGKKGKELKKSETIKLFNNSAELGNVKAQMKLAEFYKKGKYVKKNKKIRFKWLLCAANNGFREAQEQVAECLEKGYGVKKNNPKAYYWYKRAAEQGSEYGKAKAKEFELFKFYK